MHQSVQDQTEAEVNAKIEEHIREVLKLLSIKNEEVIRETPRRFRQVLQERTASDREPLDPKILKTFEMNDPGMVVVKDLEIHSLCEHHLMPFFGTCSIGYLPKNEVLGLSKLARIVNYCSNKEQLQERLTEEILKTIDSTVPNDGVVVLVKCKHFCMIFNDELKCKAETITVLKTGKFKEDPAVLQEFRDTVK